MNQEPRHSEIIAALLAGGLDPAEVTPLEARLRAAKDARAAHAALDTLDAMLEALANDVRDAMPQLTALVAEARIEADLLAMGEAQARRAGEVDLVDDVLMAARLDNLGEAFRAAVPEVDFVDEVCMAAKLTDAGDDWRAAVPEADLLEEVFLARELFTMGDGVRRAMPEIDLVDGVLRDVRRSRGRARVRVTPPGDELAARRARSGVRQAAWIGWAAAACLLLGFGLIAFGILARPDLAGSPRLADSTPTGAPSASPRADHEDGAEWEDGIAPVRVSPITVAHAALDGPEDAGSAEAGGAADEAFTLRDILLARANALAGTQGDRELLANWASLTAAQARALLEGGELTREEALGLALFLPHEEAIDLLLAQLGMNPGDPYLRLALAKNLEAGGQHGAALSHLAALRRADSYNGLAAFMEAELHMQAGNLSAAMAALERASAHEMSYAYAGTTARARAAALEASGMGAREAQLLAAITAGAVEYEHLRHMANNMLEHGLYYEGLGDYDTALSIYRSVEDMGVQVASGAGYINEQIAGLSVQEDALQHQRDLAGLLGSPETVQAITDSLRLLSLAWGGLEGYLADFNQLFSSAGIEIVNALAGSVLNHGDFADVTRDLITTALGQ